MIFNTASARKTIDSAIFALAKNVVKIVSSPK
jgi:hypothetical protein